VKKSLKYFYANLADNEGVLISGRVSLGKRFDKDSQSLADVLVSECKKNKITEIIFDRSGYKYHGYVRKFADTLREQGLKF